ncbi:MAG: hypothetical protein LQ344_007184 [Seirophora lacunosa]|nr:MAG: hypothetical protein LQ344_007184 [Seirophora lacunosa]
MPPASNSSSSELSSCTDKLLVHQEIRPSARDDLVERDVEQGVPQHVLPHEPIIETEPADTTLMDPGSSEIDMVSDSSN